MDPRAEARAVARIVREAGGELVGRVKLQKIAYLLKEAGFGDEFPFEYKLYGPYSETLARATQRACFLDMIHEDEKTTQWGDTSYSIYTLKEGFLSEQADERREQLIRLANEESSVVLELAATALYFHKREKDPTPWKTTRQRKPDKAVKFLGPAKRFYEKLQASFPQLPILLK